MVVGHGLANLLIETAEDAQIERDDQGQIRGLWTGLGNPGRHRKVVADQKRVSFRQGDELPTHVHFFAPL